MNSQVQIAKIDIEDALNLQYQFVDVRSPKEYEEFHIPGAINIPLFSNEERAEVGTLYKQKGKVFAIERGIGILSKKLESFYREFKYLCDHNNRNPIIVYCWRGGMRSKSIISLFGSLGLPLIQLDGGIRSYRYKIMDYLTNASFREKKFIVLEGFTGTRKTDMLELLEEQNYPVIDLEKMANHRGSVFGDIGKVPNSQKQFEALLFERLNEIGNSDYYIIEAESKRIGRAILPDFIIEGKQQGIRIHVDAPLSERVRTIKNMYVQESYHDKIVNSFMIIKKHISPQIFNIIMEAFDKRDYDLAFSEILMNYYDPKYAYSLKKYESDSHYIFYHDFNDGFNIVKGKIDSFIKLMEAKP